MSRKKRMSPAAVLEMFVDCVNEAEAEGFETAKNSAKLGDPPSWYDSEGRHPEIEWREGGVMMVRMPDGSQVQVKVSRVRRRGQLTIR